MIYPFVNAGETAQSRQRRAKIAFLLVPFAVVFALIFGTIGHVLGSLTSYAKDMWDLLTDELPESFRDLGRASKTGAYL